MTVLAGSPLYRQSRFLCDFLGRKTAFWWTSCPRHLVAAATFSAQAVFCPFSGLVIQKSPHVDCDPFVFLPSAQSSFSGLCKPCRTGMEKHVCTGLFNVLFTQFTFFLSIGFSCIDYFLLSIVILSNLCNSSNILPPRAALLSYFNKGYIFFWVTMTNEHKQYAECMRLTSGGVAKYWLCDSTLMSPDCRLLSSSRRRAVIIELWTTPTMLLFTALSCSNLSASHHRCHWSRAVSHFDVLPKRQWKQYTASSSISHGIWPGASNRKALYEWHKVCEW